MSVTTTASRITAATQFRQTDNEMYAHRDSLMTRFAVGEATADESSVTTRRDKLASTEVHASKQGPQLLDGAR